LLLLQVGREARRRGKTTLRWAAGRGASCARTRAATTGGERGEKLLLLLMHHILNLLLLRLLLGEVLLVLLVLLCGRGGGKHCGGVVGTRQGSRGGRNCRGGLLLLLVLSCSHDGSLDRGRGAARAERREASSRGDGCLLLLVLLLRGGHHDSLKRGLRRGRRWLLLLRSGGDGCSSRCELRGRARQRGNDGSVLLLLLLLLLLCGRYKHRSLEGRTRHCPWMRSRCRHRNGCCRHGCLLLLLLLMLVLLRSGSDDHRRVKRRELTGCGR
jgi:hypothetical protein